MIYRAGNQGAPTLIKSATNFLLPQAALLKLRLMTEKIKGQSC
jgi:hypothetical protein